MFVGGINKQRFPHCSHSVIDVRLMSLLEKDCARADETIPATPVPKGGRLAWAKDTQPEVICAND